MPNLRLALRARVLGLMFPEGELIFPEGMIQVLRMWVQFARAIAIGSTLDDRAALVLMRAWVSRQQVKE